MIYLHCDKRQSYLVGEPEEIHLFIFSTRKTESNRDGLMVINGWLSVWSKDQNKYKIGDDYDAEILISESKDFLLRSSKQANLSTSKYDAPKSKKKAKKKKKK